jgi:CheY-like chemotaxis protein
LYSGKTALVIDKNVSRKILLVDILAKIGIKPITTSSIEEGLLITRETMKMDMVFIDSKEIYEIRDKEKYNSIVSMTNLIRLGVNGYRDLMVVNTQNVCNILTSIISTDSISVKKDLLPSTITFNNRHRHMKILIVEDDENCRKSLEILLKHLRYQRVATVEDGKEAEDYCRKNLVFIIFMDVKLKTCSGIETAQKIQTHYGKVGHTFHIIFVSGLNDNYLGNYKLDSVKGILKKPVEPQKVIEMLYSLNNKSRN